VTPIDEDPNTQAASQQVLTFGTPHVGEVLADRYRLEEHIGDDSLGRQLWRGSDVILQRPVTVVLRYPGSDSAGEMLSAAVAASRIVHPHLIGVYDAIDEGDRAYVVREWVEGRSLREVVTEYGALDAAKATAIAHAVTGAIAALHATGMAHGNIHPGTVLIGDDGRVVLTDARADDAATTASDIRAIGGVLYCALTGYWPHAEAGPAGLPDGVRDSAGHLADPRQVRAGVPARLDELTSDLLDADQAVPEAGALTAELARMDSAGERALFADEPLDLDAFEAASDTPQQHRPAGRKIAIGVATLLVIAAVGTIAAARTLGTGSNQTPSAASSGTAAPGRGPAGSTVIKLSANQVRIVDPDGNGRELDGAAKAVDGDPKSMWRTDRYQGAADFGHLKKGMGVLLDLGKETPVASVEVQLNVGGATLELRGGATDPGATKAGDTQLVSSFQPIGEPKVDAGSTALLAGDPDKPVRYLMVWITKLPAENSGGYQVGVLEIIVRGS
jgi:eukaryotic-like serine/threonine-protein kinase